MAANKTIVLVTGGNAGIGFELVSQFLADASKHILLGSRSPTKGAAAISSLQSRNLPGSVELLDLDVSSPSSISVAAEHVTRTHGRLDALVNNAAVALVPGTLAEAMTSAFATNAIGPLLMVEEFAPLLRKSSGTPRIVNVSTGQSLVPIRLNPNAPGSEIKAPQYRATKAALNMITAEQIVEFGKEGWKVFGYCPGFTVSNLGPHNKSENGAKPTSEGAEPIRRIVDGERDEEHGKFLTGEGQYAW